MEWLFPSVSVKIPKMTQIALLYCGSIDSKVVDLKFWYSFQAFNFYHKVLIQWWSPKLIDNCLKNHWNTFWSSISAISSSEPKWNKISLYGKTTWVTHLVGEPILSDLSAYIEGSYLAESACGHVWFWCTLSRSTKKLLSIVKINL